MSLTNRPYFSAAPVNDLIAIDQGRVRQGRHVVADAVRFRQGPSRLIAAALKDAKQCDTTMLGVQFFLGVPPRPEFYATWHIPPSTWIEHVRLLADSGRGATLGLSPLGARSGHCGESGVAPPGCRGNS